MLKRLFDLSVTVMAALFLAPLFVIVAIFVRVNLGSPVLFRQVRPGMNAQPFTILKFRSMRDATDAHGQILPDSERLTTFGKLLRATSLDELPGFWNVIRGDMSLVGPRPLLMKYIPLYNDRQKRRMEVRPGITGLAQVNGRNALSWEDKFTLDVEYVDRQNLLLDLKIIMLTAVKVFKREGISADGEATMQPFRGNEQDKST